MDLKFDPSGHIPMNSKDFYEAALESPRRLINDALLRMTPWVFEKYADYCGFVNELAALIHVHPQSVIVRGSALLGFSTSPNRAKVWNRFRPVPTNEGGSDIDVAVVDASLFYRMDREVREWESEQPPPAFNDDPWLSGGKREYLRNAGCVYDKLLPYGVCQGHVDVMQNFDTTQFLGRRHEVSCFIIRDWWCARMRWEYDIKKLTEGVKQGSIGAPWNFSLKNPALPISSSTPVPPLPPPPARRRQSRRPPKS